PPFLRLLREQSWPMIALAAIASVTLAIVIVVEKRSDACNLVANKPGAVVPNPSKSSDLTFCPVLVNNGQEITGPFHLSGVVDGSAEDRENLVMLIQLDETTCDMDGHRPSGNYYFVRKPDLQSADGSWTFKETFGGYDRSVTMGRIYHYVVASPETVQDMRDDEGDWKVAHPDNPGDYPGLVELPGDAKSLAQFDVPPGTPSEAVAPCAP
ncbi:hypothetical protein LWF15_30790, partial [Kineosporia rhizophila]|uniref:hypothetical protein n=1 Tax=Kineosporia rhizophila TaxID=84633 RepID=UPI000A4EC8DC